MGSIPGRGTKILQATKNKTKKSHKVNTLQIFLITQQIHVFLFFKKLINLFIYFWLCWVFVSVRGLSLVVASGGHSSLRCAGLSLSRPLLLRSTDSRCAGSVVVAHGPSCSAACGILPDQGSNPCPRQGRQILNHCATREAPHVFLILLFGSRHFFTSRN